MNNFQDIEQKSLMLLSLKILERDFADLESILYFFNSDHKKFLEFITLFENKSLHIPKKSEFRNIMIASVYLHCVLTNKNIKQYMAKFGVVGQQNLKAVEKIAMKLKNRLSYNDLMLVKEIAILQGDEDARRK